MRHVPRRRRVRPPLTPHPSSLTPSLPHSLTLTPHPSPLTPSPSPSPLTPSPPHPPTPLQAPRGKTDSLVSRFTLLRYAVTGTYVGLATVGAFVHFYTRRGVPLALLRQWTMCSHWEVFEGGKGLLGYGNACAAFDPSQGKLGASACALTTLVVMEMLRACCAVSETQSLVTKPPWANRWLLLGVTLPMLLHLSVLYTPRFPAIFQLAPLSQQDWLSVASLSLPLVLLEELLKLLARCLHVS